MRKFLFRLLRISGLPVFFREIIQKNKVSILLFHDISAKTADKTFKYLKENYNIIELETYIRAIEKKDFSRIPPKALVITFDDGHLGNYEMLPVIKKYNIPVTIFLCASIINTNRHFWFKYKNLSVPPADLKPITNEERLKMLSKEGFEQDKEFKNPQALQKKHLEEMKPFVNFQSHTLFHPILPSCKYEVAQSEIFHSKKILEAEFGLNIDTISYPNGDYSDRDIALPKEAGYKYRITVDFGFNTIDTDPYRLKRLPSNDTDDMNELMVKASGLWDLLKTRNGRRQQAGYTKKTE